MAPCHLSTVTSPLSTAMSIPRNTLFQGPGHLVLGTTAILAADDIKVSISNETEDIVSNGYGPIGRRRKGRKITVTCTPLHWDNTALLLPHAATQIGESIFGATDTPLKVVPRNGAASGILIKSAAVTKMPAVFYSATKKPLGSMEFTGILANGADPALDASYWETAAPGALPAPDLAKIRNGIYRAAWGPFTAFVAQDGFELSPDMKLSNSEADGYGILDMYLAELTASVKCTPLGLTMADLLGALGGPIGADLARHDLILSTGPVETPTVVATLPACQLITGEAEYGNDKRRLGAIEFKSVRTASAGTLAPLWTLV